MYATVDYTVHVQHPATPPAPRTRQQVYATSWNRLSRINHTASLDANNGWWSTLGQREALVASRIAAWLGSDDGSSYLATAESLVPHFRSKTDAYVAAWAATNIRHAAIESGWRLLERLMIEQFVGTTPQRPNLAIGDFEIAERMAAWLGSGEGQIFITRNETLTAPTEFSFEND